MDYLYLEIICTLAFTIYLYEKYADKSIKLPIKILVVTVWFLTFFGIFIFPLDVYYSKQNTLYDNNYINSQFNNKTSMGIPSNSKENEITKENNEYIISNIKFLWSLLYWVIYVLSWVIIPIFQEYELAGDFSFSRKLKKSIKKNLYFYSIFLFVGSIFVCYMIFRQKFTMNHLLSLLVSTSNAWGIFLIIFLLGYGLVALPKNILQQSETQNRSRYLEWLAKDTRDELNAKKDYLSLLLNVS